jgi:hypothetical protein
MNLKKPTRAIIKQILKYFGITVAVILFLFGIVSWVVVENKNDWLLAQIQSAMNEYQSGQLEIAATNLKLFRSFPDVTIELDRIDYYEHHDTLRTPNEKPILHADQLFVVIELLPLINDELKISEISLSNAQLNVIEYQNGELNINRALLFPAKPKVVKKKVAPKTTPSTSPLPKKKTTPIPPPQNKTKTNAPIQIDLQSVALRNFRITWSPYNSSDTSAILIKELELEMELGETVVNAQLTSAHSVQSLYINGTSIPPRNLIFNAEIQYDLDNQELTISESEINYDIFNLELQGTYSHKKNQLFNLQVDASSNDLKLLSKIMKPDVLKQNPDLLKKGDIYIEGRIFGELKNRPPQFDISFGVRDLAFALPKNRGTFKNIGFDGKLKSGELPNYSQAVFEIKKLRGELPGGALKGEFSLNNFVEPYLKYDFHSKLKLDAYDEVFQINSLKELSGTVSLEANFDGPLQYFAQHQTDSSRSSAITLGNLSFVLTKTNQRISGLSGKIENRDNQVTIQQLTFTYGKNDLQLNATIDNFVYFLFKHERDIFVNGNIQSNELHTKDFLFDSTSTAHIQDKIKNLFLDFQFNTTSKKNALGKTVINDLTFDIKKLSAQLEELPDLTLVTAKGVFSKTDDGLKLNLNNFHATMPMGTMDITGDLLIPKKRLWVFHAQVKANKFPWNYVQDLVAEIKSGAEPTAKKLSVKQLDILTADLDVSASITTYPLDFNRLDIRNSRVNFSFPGSKTLSAEKLNLSLENLRFTHPENSGALTGLKSTKGIIQLKQLSVPGLNKIDVNMNVTGENDTLDIDFSSASQKAKNEQGNLFMDISKKEIAYQLTYTVKDADLESFIERFYKKKFMEGEIDYTLDLKTTGSSMDQVKQNMRGFIEITGDSLDLYGVDVDNVLRKFEKSQNFNLTDVGAVIIAGPLGLAVTKGSDFVSLATVNMNPKHHTEITSLLTRWKLENQKLRTEDVAFTTRLNRIAFDGSIDFARDSIPGLTIAVIDKNGCSLMDQKLYGKTTALKTGKLNITKTLFGSVINFVNVVVGKDCKPVYNGMVKAPSQ